VHRDSPFSVSLEILRAQVHTILRGTMKIVRAQGRPILRVSLVLCVQRDALFACVPWKFYSTWTNGFACVPGNSACTRVQILRVSVKIVGAYRHHFSWDPGN
jgi:hypothetical protein